MNVSTRTRKSNKMDTYTNKLFFGRNIFATYMNIDGGVDPPIDIPIGTLLPLSKD